MIKKYITKPVVIEALQYNGNLDIVHFLEGNYFIDAKSKQLYITTLEGNMKADIGDYIIKGLRGEFYPCKPDVFEKKYEEVESAE